MEQPNDDDVFEQIKKRLSDDVYEQIKDLDCMDLLTKEQESLVVLDEELGLCEKCKQPKNSYYWCQLCNLKQNFQNWTSGNHIVDTFIQKIQLKATQPHEVIEWIEYDRFENIEYLAKGGFGTTFKAIWKDGRISINGWDSENNQWIREKRYKDCPNFPVVLKSLHNSQNITADFLNEIESHVISTASSPGTIVKCYGVTRDPKTNNFMMVMEYAQYGSLRQHLNNSFNSLNWHNKIFNLFTIADGLDQIHRQGLIHHDFHSGNILNNKDYSDTTYSLITDLGLCKPANAETSQNNNKQIYGVLPYVAPEVLRGKEYTQASDIYGFGVIAHELCTGLPPYHDIAHDGFLAIKICQGLRPKSRFKIPQLILDIIQQCWDADPLKRPKAKELRDLFYDLWNQTKNGHDSYEENSLINQQIREVNEINKQLPPLTIPSTDTLSYVTHPQAIYTSRLLEYKSLPEPENVDSNDNSLEYSESIKIDLSNLHINPKDSN